MSSTNAMKENEGEQGNTERSAISDRKQYLSRYLNELREIAKGFSSQSFSKHRYDQVQRPFQEQQEMLWLTQ